MLREEPVDQGGVLHAPGIVAVPVVGIQLLVPGADLLEQRVACFRGTDVVLEADVDDDRARDPAGEVDAVEVRDRGLDVSSPFGIEAQVIVDLFVRLRVRQLDGVHVPTEIGGARRGRANLPAHRR